MVPHLLKSLLFALVILLHLASLALAASDLPVPGGVVTSGIGWRTDPFGSGKLVFHRGIDIAVPVGTPVRAVQGGRVLFAGTHGGHGSTVIIEHAGGDRTLYGHNSQIRVGTGEKVAAGTVLAYSGNSGRSTGPHIHFERMPGGRPFEVARAEDEAVPLGAEQNRRYLLEQRMEESVNSILRRIDRSTSPAQGG